MKALDKQSCFWLKPLVVLLLLCCNKISKIGKLKYIGFGEYQIFGDVTLGKDEICVKMTGLNFQVSWVWGEGGDDDDDDSDEGCDSDD